VLEHHGGMYALWNGWMTSEVENFPWTHSAHISLGNITIYKYWVQPVVVEVVGKIQQLVEATPKLVEVYFLLLIDLSKLFG
jgi:hypothetical protein